MIKLTNADLVSSTGTNSRGNQLKFKRDNIWYKTDFLGYEGLSESLCSNLLLRSNIENFVVYHPVYVNYDPNDSGSGRILAGCKSDNFQPDNAQLVTVSRLFKSVYNESPEEYLNSNDTKIRIERTIQGISHATGLTDIEIGKYLTAMIELDAVTLNDDRHFNNIAVMYHNGEYYLPPIFDNGAAFMSDRTFYYHYDTTKVESKPFSRNFDEQKECLESLYGQQLVVLLFDYKCLFTKDVLKTYNDPDLEQAIKSIVSLQIEKYTDIFVDNEKRFINKSRIINNTCFNAGNIGGEDQGDSDPFDIGDE